MPEFPTAARDGPIGDPIVGRAFGVKEPVRSTVILANYKRYASATLNVRPNQKETYEVRGSRLVDGEALTHIGL